MPQVGFACPECLAGGNTVPLNYTPFQFGFKCDRGHDFQVDIQTLQAMKTVKIPLPAPPKRPRPDCAALTLQLPKKLIEGLQQRFKDRMDNTVEALLIAMLDNDAFVMTGFDVEKLRQPEFLGQKVVGAEKLAGLVYALRSERDEARREADAFKANTSGTKGGTSVDVNEIDGDFVQIALRFKLEDFLTIKNKATFNGKPPAAYMAEVISNALENGWF